MELLIVLLDPKDLQKGKVTIKLMPSSRERDSVVLAQSFGLWAENIPSPIPLGELFHVLLISCNWGSGYSWGAMNLSPSQVGIPHPGRQHKRLPPRVQPRTRLLSSGLCGWTKEIRILTQRIEKEKERKKKKKSAAVEETCVEDKLKLNHFL